MDKSLPPSSAGATNGARANGASEALAAFNDASLAADWRAGDVAPVGAARYGVEESEGGFDFAQLLAVMRRRWPVMLAIFVLAVAGGAAISVLTRPVYQSVATLEVDTSPGADIAQDIPGLSSFVASKQSQSIDTQIEILRGGPTLLAAKKRLPSALQRKMDGFGPVVIDQIETSNLLSVTARSYDSRAAAALANAVCQQYIALSLQKKVDNSSGAIRYLESKIADIKRQLDVKQSQLRDFKQSAGLISIEAQATALANNVSGLQTALQQAQSESAGLTATLRGQQQSLAALPTGQSVPVAIERNPQVVALQGQLTQLEVEHAAALREYVPGSFKVRGLDANIAAVRGRLKGLAQTTVSSWKPDPLLDPLRQNVAATQGQLWSSEARIRALQQQLSGAKSALDRLPSQELQFTQLSTDAAILQGGYQTLTAKLQNLRVGAQGQTPDARVVFPAQASTSPVLPDKKRTLLYSVLLGALAAVALAMLVDALDNRIYNDADAQRATSLPVLAHIPLLKNPAQQSLLHSGDRVTPLLESFRMLRANIAFSATDRPIRAVVVTSSVPGEGKSNSALNLAMAAALGGERTILLDLDLRRPTQHKLCGLPNAIGFTNVISGQAALEDALQAGAVPGLRVLTSGPVPPNPFRLLNSQTARQTISKIIESADFIVVDTPPMLGLADARLISSLVDGTLMVISCQETGRREAGRASDLLVQTGHEVLGTILTKVPSNSDALGHYQSYDRYYNADDDQDESETPALEEGRGKRRSKAR